MAKIKFTGILILLLAAVLVGCNQKTAFSSTGTKQKDLALFVQTLESKHKNLYAKISKEDFNKERIKLEQAVGSMSDAEFYYSLRSLLALVGDAHTSMDFYDGKYKYLHGLTFGVTEFNKSWYIVLADKANEEHLGSRLFYINDVPINEVYMASKRIMSFENEIWAKEQFSNTINFKEALEYIGVVKKDEPIILTVENSEGKQSTVEMKPRTEDEIMSQEIVRFKPKNTPTTAPNGFYRSMPIDHTTFFIQYNVCKEANDLSMKEFTKIIETELSQKEYKKVIIDLRYNSGGNSAVINPLLAMLKKQQAQKSFEVYTLIGASTFSSGIMNAIDTVEDLHSTLVGRPTGGNVNSYGELKSFKLKSLPIQVMYSTKYFELIKGYTFDSLYPDIEIGKSFEDYSNGVDVEIEFIKDYKKE